HTRFSRDWSSDVRSSDLVPSGHISADYFACFANRIGDLLGADHRAFPPFVGMMSNGTSGDVNNINFKPGAPARSYGPYEKMNERSEERRVGKVWGSSCTR